MFGGCWPCGGMSSIAGLLMHFCDVALAQTVQWTWRSLQRRCRWQWARSCGVGRVEIHLQRSPWARQTSPRRPSLVLGGARWWSNPTGWAVRWLSSARLPTASTARSFHLHTVLPSTSQVSAILTCPREIYSLPGLVYRYCGPTTMTVNALKGQGINWLHFAIQV